jgi:DNA-binding CsgD family transcriptional regulator
MGQATRTTESSSPPFPQSPPRLFPEDAALPRPSAFLFDEACITATERADRPFIDSRLVEELLAAGTPHGRERIVRSVLGMMGFDALAYATLDLTGGSKRWINFFESYVSRTWLACYLARGYEEIDPRLEAACRDAAPCVWDLDSLAAIRPSPLNAQTYRTFLFDLDAHGVRSGLIFGIGAAAGASRVVVSMSSSSRKRERIGGAIVAQALVLGLALHEFLRCSGRPLGSDKPRARMSPVEMEIVGALAAGLSDKEIAQRLLTTHHNVDYHLRSIRRKLGAANRSHLAYLAGKLSLA